MQLLHDSIFFENMFGFVCMVEKHNSPDSTVLPVKCVELSGNDLYLVCDVVNHSTGHPVEIVPFTILCVFGCVCVCV